MTTISNKSSPPASALHQVQAATDPPPISEVQVEEVGALAAEGPTDQVLRTSPAAAPSLSLATGRHSSVSLGDKGPLVAELQAGLRQHGAKLNATGEFDLATQIALKRLQRTFGLPQSGLVDENTAFVLRLPPGEALESARASAGNKARLLGATAEEEARRRNTMGACAAGVYHALEDAGLEPGIALSDAYMYGERLADRKDMKEVKGLTEKELQSLPPGSILVYGKSAAHVHGHIAIVTEETFQGEALEASDHLQRIHLVGGAASYGNDFGKGPTDGTRFRVFIPQDGDE